MELDLCPHVMGYLKTRNHLVFEGDDSVTGLHLIVWKQASTYYHVRNKYARLESSTSNLTAEPAHWTPPPLGWIKLNTDGVSKGNPGPASGGGLFRDPSGTFLSAFIFTCGSCNAQTSELWAVLHGLRMAKRLGFQKIIIEVDSTVVYECLQKREKEIHVDYNLITSCRNMLDEADWDTEMNVVHRNSNSAADALANWALQTATPYTELFTIPDCIRSFISVNPAIGNST